MELQTQNNQDLATTEQFQTVRFQGVQSLPTEFLNTLPEIVRAEITQSTLKQTSLDNPNEIEAFINEVFAKVNPTFADGENSVKLAESEIRRYAKQSLITTEEFFFARTLLSRGLLYDSDGEKMKPYKIIDFEFFNQVETAYINYKNYEKSRENAFAKIEKFLEAKPEKTPEELQKERQERFNNLVKMVLENEGDFSDRKFSIASFFYDDFKDEFPELSKEEKERILISKQKAEILKERKREKKLHLTPSELKKADEILSSGKYLPKDHIIYNLALMEIKKELVIDFILSKFKAK